MQARPHLVIFARFPQAGVGKRRLAGGVGETASIRFQRVRLRVLVARLAQDPRWRTWLAVTPDRSGPWPTGVKVIAQGRGDLGLRMSRVFKTLPRGRAIIVGADIPGITADEIARVFHRLKGNDAVFGPADDGGYWLVGLKRIPRLLLPFDNVRWSTASALEDTERNMAVGTIAHVTCLSDVDDADALRRHPNWCRVIPIR